MEGSKHNEGTMKKLLSVTVLAIMATSALAHSTYERRCSTRYDRRGNAYTKCTNIRVYHDHHGHHDGYGDGFFDGMLASSYLTITTSDILDGDDKIDAFKNEVSLTLSLLTQGIDEAISPEIKDEMEAIKAADESLKDASDEEVLEAILLAE